MRIALAIAVTLTACSAESSADVVDGRRARELVESGALLLDVRTPEEFAAGRAVGAVNVPFDQIRARAHELGGRSRPVVVYCRSGRRSAIAAGELRALGFTEVYDLRELSDWTGPTEEGPPAPKRVDPAAAAGKVLTPFKTSLKKALSEAMQQHGPVGAIEVCSSVAPELAREAAKDGVKVGRASDRLRSEANAAPAWVTPLLDAYVQSKGGRPQVVELPGDKLGYVEPITVQTLCLSCHGKSLGPEVAAAIAQRYPDDAARGYEAGDFRGVYWVELERRLAEVSPR